MKERWRCLKLGTIYESLLGAEYHVHTWLLIPTHVVMGHAVYDTGKGAELREGS